MNSVKRNADICRMYLMGRITLQQIGELFGLSKERVRQIVKTAGFNQAHRRQTQTPQRVYLGIGVASHVKEMMRREAEKQGISLSELTGQALEQSLVA